MSTTVWQLSRPAASGVSLVALGLGGGQGIDDLDGGGEQCRLGGQAGGMGQGDGQMGFAHPHTAEQDHIAVLGQELQPEQMLHLGAIDLFGPAPVEVRQRLDAGQMGRLQAPRHQSRVPPGRLPRDQFRQEALMAPGLPCRLGQQRGVMLADVAQAQPLQLPDQDRFSDAHGTAPHRPISPRAATPAPGPPGGG